MTDRETHTRELKEVVSRVRRVERELRRVADQHETAVRDQVARDADTTASRLLAQTYADAAGRVRQALCGSREGQR